jgi:hypothetical protein
MTQEAILQDEDNRWTEGLSVLREEYKTDERAIAQIDRLTKELGLGA